MRSDVLFLNGSNGLETVIIENLKESFRSLHKISKKFMEKAILAMM
jgi:hypothetical protein